MYSYEEPVETGLYIYLFVFSDLNKTKKPDRRVIMLFASPFTDMNEYNGKHSKKKGILLCAICMVSVWQKRSDETHLEG